MTGRYKIVVRNRRVTYTLEIERNITIIRGDSATGKTSLIQSLAAYEELKEKSGVSVISSRECHVLRGNDWEDLLKKWTDSIVFVDEGCAFISSKEFAETIRNSDHYYVLITRESLFQLPYSVNAVLELKKTTSRFKHTYNRAYPYYHMLPNVQQELAKRQMILCEDSHAGQEWFSFIANQYGLCCISAEGKTLILDKLKQTGGKQTLVFADGAAFGPEMERVYQYSLLHPSDVLLYLPESFEWIILKSGIVQKPGLADMLEKPYDHIQSRSFFSWERFFTDYLTQATKNTQLAYTKKKLNPSYLSEENARKMLQVIENG